MCVVSLTASYQLLQAVSDKEVFLALRRERQRLFSPYTSLILLSHGTGLRLGLEGRHLVACCGAFAGRACRGLGKATLRRAAALLSFPHPPLQVAQFPPCRVHLRYGKHLTLLASDVLTGKKMDALRVNSSAAAYQVVTPPGHDAESGSWAACERLAVPGSPASRPCWPQRRAAP